MENIFSGKSPLWKMSPGKSKSMEKVPSGKIHWKKSSLKRVLEPMSCVHRLREINAFKKKFYSKRKARNT